MQSCKARYRGAEMSLKTNYVVTLRGSLPADLSERLAVAHAQTIRNRRFSVSGAPLKRNGQPPSIESAYRRNASYFAQ